MKRTGLAALALLALLLCSAATAPAQRAQIVLLPTLEVIIAQAAAEAGVPVKLAEALARVESRMDAHAVNLNRNGTRDLGLYQLNSRYLAEFAWRYNAGRHVDPFDPVASARVALRHLAVLKRATGSWRAAVAAYNSGLTRYRTGSLPEQTVEHVRRVFEGGNH